MSENAKICGLCGHAMTLERCGSAAVNDTPLCHADDHDCYHRWTVYGERRDGYRSRAGRDAALAAAEGTVKPGDHVQWNGMPGYCTGTVESVDPDGAVFVRLDPNFALYVSPDKLRVIRQPI